MVTSILHFTDFNKFFFKRFLQILPLSVFIAISSPFHNAIAQNIDEGSSWSIGLHAGVLSGNLPTASASNALISRFYVENDYYFTAAFQAGFAISEYESLNLTLSRGEFSVFTDHEFWPDVLFKSQYYSATLSTHLWLRRFIESMPNRVNPYGSFGLGLLSNQNTASLFNPQGTAQIDFDNDSSNYLTFLMTAGLGLDFSLSSRISFTLHFNHHFLSSDIIDKNLAGEILRNEFIQTTRNWSTFTSGIRVNFGRSKVRSFKEPEPVRDDFQIISTISVDRLRELDELLSDTEERNEVILSQSDSVNIPTTLSPVDIDSTDAIPAPQMDSEEETILENELVNTDRDDEVSAPQKSLLDEDISPPETSIPEVLELIDTQYDYITFVEQPKFGLNGTVVENISESFTIVLHSFSDHSAAIEVVERLNGEGYRVVTQDTTVNEIEYRRVGVGQFESRNDARSAAGNLPEPYRSNYFIVQIQE